MTRKHFQAIADTIAYRYSNLIHLGKHSEAIEVAILAEDLSYTLAQFNPHFDRQRFLDACLPGHD